MSEGRGKRSALARFGLCGGVLAGADFRTLVETAGAAGFRFVTLWPSHYQEARANGLTPADMRALLADNGVAVSELDPYCRWLPLGEDASGIAGPFHRYTEADFFEIADALGARSVNLIHDASPRLSSAEVVDALGAFCDRAFAHGLVVSIEFMAWSPIRDLGSALELVRAVGRDGCGVNVDTWHHFRTGGTVAELDRLAPGEVTGIQLSDVAQEPWSDILEETARARELPGEGMGLASEALAALAKAGPEVPVNVEVFSDDLRRRSHREAALAVAESVQQLAYVRSAGS